MKKHISKIILVGILLCYIFSGLIYGKPSFFGYRVFFIMSESMEPTIQTHQIVLAEVMDGEDAKVGDVVAYSRGDGIFKRTVIHRIVEIRDDGDVILKGDNNKEPDPPVKADRVEYGIVWY